MGCTRVMRLLGRLAPALLCVLMLLPGAVAQAEVLTLVELDALGAYLECKERCGDEP